MAAARFAAYGAGALSEIPQPLWLIFAAMVGASFGSFLNVVIYRLPIGESIVSPPSRCPSCGNQLPWHDNVPIVGWLLLRGRCRQCRNPISIQYPIVELITAVLFVLVVWLTPPGLLLAKRLLLVCMLIALFGIDLAHQILPNSITLPGILVGLLLSAFTPPGWRDALIGAVLGAAILYAIAWGYYLWRREEGLGMGDVKMLAMVGAFLGWKAVLVTLVLSSFSGALIGVALIASQRGSMKLALPFGTFLALGTLVAMLVGDPLVAWYAGFFEM
jgi:leader peptidase (prepilin peptidase)/N-methyltransferase